MKIETDNLEMLMGELKAKFPKSMVENVSMKAWTTFHCLAKARAIASPATLDELKTIVVTIANYGVEWRVIGRGSNLLVRDGGFGGVLIELSKGFASIESVKESTEKVRVRVGSGVANGTLLQWLRDKNFGGFGFAFGIPGSIGGGIRMNAGTPDGWFGDILCEVAGIRADGQSSRFSVTPKDFIYRDFPKGRDLILIEGTFEFSKSSREAVEKEISNAKIKRSNQPLELPNIGSVFKNPENNYAGKLIEAAGLKGYRVGDAQISSKHANFIVNLKSATTAEVLKVMGHAQKVVREKHGVELEPEVHLIGVDA